jgi:hypothetical protein
MRASEKYKSIFENKPKYRYKSYTSNLDRTAKQNENQQFVVPWQMAIFNEKKYLIE